MGMVAAVEAGIGGEGEAAAASGGGDVAAAGQAMGIAGVRGFTSHESLLDGMRWGIYCRVLFAKVLKILGMHGKSAQVPHNSGT